MFKNLKCILVSLLLTMNFTSKASEVIPVAVVGSGCAGLSAAYAISEYGFKTVIFTGPIKGGDLNAKTEVGNWLGIPTTMGNKIMPQVVDTALSFGAEVIESKIEDIDFSSTPFKLTDSKGKSYYAHKIVIATGATERLLSATGAEKNRDKLLYNWDIHKNLDAYKANTKGKKIAIIGGGIDAMKKAFYAASGGAKEVKIFVRGNDLRLPPWRKKFLSFKANIIKIAYNHTISKVEDIGNNRLRISTDNSDTYDADMVVVSIGMTPRSDIFKEDIKTDNNGFIVVDGKTQQTNIPGVYACGDVTDASGPQPQALIAVGNGMVAGYGVVGELLQMGIPQQDVFFKKAKSIVRSSFNLFGS